MWLASSQCVGKCIPAITECDKVWVTFKMFIDFSVLDTWHFIAAKTLSHKMKYSICPSVLAKSCRQYMKGYSCVKGTPTPGEMICCDLSSLYQVLFGLVSAHLIKVYYKSLMWFLLVFQHFLDTAMTSSIYPMTPHNSLKYFFYHIRELRVLLSQSQNQRNTAHTNRLVLGEFTEFITVGSGEMSQ